MPQKSPGTSYTRRPVRKLKLPKIAPTKTKGFVEEYFYVLLAAVFLTVAILGKAGGFSTYNALLVAAWITASSWFAHQWRGYLAEKSKPENGQTVQAAAAPRVETREAPLPLPPGMKPMIGPQWPVKPGSRPIWPKLPKRQPASAAPPPPSSTPTVPSSSAPGQGSQISETDSPDKQPRFVYERPTLPDRAPKLPNNWVNPNNKKAKNKKPKP